MRIEVSTVIDRPIDEVFRVQGPDHYLNHPRWDPSVTDLEPLGDAPFALGSRFKMTRMMMGRPDTNVFEVVEYEPPRRIAIETRKPGFQLRITAEHATVSPKQTRLTLVGDAKVGGVRGLLAPIMKGKLTRDSAANLARIKDLVEAGGGQ